MPDETIRSVLAEHGQLAVDVAVLTDDDDLYAAGLTSHATVNVMLALEDELSVEFPEHLMRRATFQSIGTIRSAIDECAGEQVAGTP